MQDKAKYIILLGKIKTVSRNITEIIESLNSFNESINKAFTVENDFPQKNVLDNIKQDLINKKIKLNQKVIAEIENNIMSNLKEK